MIVRKLDIGRWNVLFLLDVYRDDVDDIILYLGRLDAPDYVVGRTVDLVLHSGYNTGLTYTDPEKKEALVMVRHASSGAEFIDTLVHEVHHLAVGIASSLGIDLDGEGPAYLSGDSARDLADVICSLGCSRCSQDVMD